MEMYVVAHGRGYARGECRDLFVYVHKEGVGGPPAEFLDRVAVDAVKFHGHGSSSSEGVAADKFGVKTGFVVSQGAYGVFEETVDASCVDMLGLSRFVPEGRYWSGCIRCVCHDVVDAVC